MLLRAIAYAIKVSDYSGCRIITVDSKQEAQGFYEKFGFKVVGPRKHQEIVPMYLDWHKNLMNLEEGQRKITEWK